MRELSNMESRPRANIEQFSLMLEYMESHGDLSRPVAGLQGRQRSEQLWLGLATMLNSVGGSSGVTKTSDRWKRVWSDWKTKIKKKAAIINRDIHGTGGGPSKGKPLTPLEDRVLRLLGITSITGQITVEEAGFEVPAHSHLQVERVPSPVDEIELVCSPPAPASSDAPPAHTFPVAGPSQARVCTPTPITTPLVGPSMSRTAQGRSPVSSVSTPRRARPTGRQRRHRQGPFDRATSEFVAVEQSRLRLERERLLLDKERVELEKERLRVEGERIRVEGERIRVEEGRVENERMLRDTIIQFNSNITGLLLRLAPLFDANRH